MRHATALLFMLMAFTGSAQLGRKELRTDSGLVVLHYFKNGKLSTTEWIDRDDRFGRSIAYDQSGKETFSYHTRRIAGHASVHFSYHTNGAVSKAEVSDAPDAGIQWYRSTTTFDEAGNRTDFSEEGRDNYGPLHSPGRIDLREQAPVEVKVQPNEEVVVCQKMFVNEVYLVNPTKWTCQVRVLVDDPSPALKAGTFQIGPRDTLLIGSYSVGEQFEEPEKHARVFVSRKKGNGPYFWMAQYRLSEIQVTPEHRRYYRTIKGWVSTKKIW